MDDEGDTLSLRAPPKKTSSFNLSSCFQSHSSSADYQHFPSSSPSAPQSPSHFLSPSSWFRSVSGVASSPVRKGAGRRRRHSADFSYDPLSYSLNFDQGDRVRSPVAAAAVPRRRLRDLELPPPVRSPLNRESEKDEAAPNTATSANATTREMLF